MGKKKLYTKEEVKEHLAELKNYEKAFRSAQKSNTSLGVNVKDFTGFFGKTIKILNQLNRPKRDYS
jgi:predicted metallo-beta-lactamase superfamily hydrolase